MKFAALPGSTGPKYNRVMKEVESYLAKLSDDQKKPLEQIRNLVKEMAPDAIEGISYGMPGFKYKGKYLLGYAAFKDHLSFFPTSTPVEAFQKELKDFKISKGTIQFTAENPIPEELLKQIIEYRVQSL